MTSTKTTTQVLAKTVNGVPVEDLSNTVEAIKATPSIAKFKFRVRNQWVDASQNVSTADSFLWSRPGAGTNQAVCAGG